MGSEVFAPTIFLEAMERYEIVKDIGSGNFGVAKLVRDKRTREQFAVKFIERGQKVWFLSNFVVEFFLGIRFFHMDIACFGLILRLKKKNIAAD